MVNHMTSKNIKSFHWFKRYLRSSLVYFFRLKFCKNSINFKQNCNKNLKKKKKKRRLISDKYSTLLNFVYKINNYIIIMDKVFKCQSDITYSILSMDNWSIFRLNALLIHRLIGNQIGSLDFHPRIWLHNANILLPVLDLLASKDNDRVLAGVLQTDGQEVL